MILILYSPFCDMYLTHGIASYPDFSVIFKYLTCIPETVK